MESTRRVVNVLYLSVRYLNLNVQSQSSLALLRQDEFNLDHCANTRVNTFQIWYRDEQRQDSMFN